MREPLTPYILFIGLILSLVVLGQYMAVDNAKKVAAQAAYCEMPGHNETLCN
jgi:hypothetical protein